MKKSLLCFFAVLSAVVFCGCGVTGEKTASLFIVYAIAALCSLFIFVAYFFMISKKDKWSALLFTSVFVVNVGYFLLSTADTLNIALWANRIAYFGSVFLPLSMFMIIVRVTNIKLYKWVPTFLFALSVIVFFIAASPGYLDIYYKEVTLATVNGVTILDKVYGPLHIIYLFYLLGYFTAMVSTIAYATAKKRIESNVYAVIIAIAVFVNIGVWFFGQVVSVDFEFLSISYILTEIFILGLYMLIQDAERRELVLTKQTATVEKIDSEQSKIYSDDEISGFKNGILTLTATEKRVYELYIEGSSTRDVMNSLDISENTLKYHNRNIYTKLGVANRRQMIEVYCYMNKNSSEE